MNHKHWRIIHRLLLLCLLLAVMVLAGGYQPAQAGSKLPLSVPANIEWISTGIWLFSDMVGSEINIKTTGKVMTVQGGQDSQSGPEGQPDAICEDMIIFDEVVLTCALEGAPYGQLIGRVGDVVFPISDASSFIVPTNGFFYMTVNDYLGTYYDNTGEFTVLIEFK